MNAPYNPVSDEVAPQSGDIKRLLALKIAKLLYGAIFGGVPINVTGISGGGGGEGMHIVATTLAGFKAVDTDGVYTVRDVVWAQFTEAGSAPALYVLRTGNTSSDPDSILPNDHNDATNNVFWERGL